MSRVWITGVAGFLGSHLADALLAAGHEVGGNDNMSGGDIANVPPRIRFIRLDCNDRDELARALAGYTHLVHCAAAPYEGLSFFSPHYITTNVFGCSVAAFSAAIAAGVGRIVFCSSMARYGAQIPPYRESQEPSPCDPYGTSKLAGEAVLRNLCEAHGVEYVIACPGNIIGPRQRFDDPFRGVASIFINLALQQRELMIFGDGEQKRRFSPVDCCVEALMKMLFWPGLSGEVINIGPYEGGAITVNALADTIWRLCGNNDPTRVRHLPQRVGDVRFAYTSVDKAIRLLGLVPGMTLGQCLRAMVEDVRRRGPKPFNYDLPIEIRNERTPTAWTERLF
jgi:UDP-glucose 4-epimerase